MGSRSPSVWILCGCFCTLATIHVTDMITGHKRLSLMDSIAIFAGSVIGLSLSNKDSTSADVSIGFSI